AVYCSPERPRTREHSRSATALFAPSMVPAWNARKMVRFGTKTDFFKNWTAHHQQLAPNILVRPFHLHSRPPSPSLRASRLCGPLPSDIRERARTLPSGQRSSLSEGRGIEGEGKGTAQTLRDVPLNTNILM